MSTAGRLPGPTLCLEQVQNLTAEDMGAIISRSIIAAVQTLTPTTTGAAAAGSTKYDKGSKSTFSKDDVATLMGFPLVNSALKLPSFWRHVQASKKSTNNTTDTFRTILMEDMKTWTFHNRQRSTKGYILKKEPLIAS
jgi:hypothetical protein